MRLLEVYPSVQGEGPRTGKPITFVRFAGCNMRCPGWPCDTQHAIKPELYSGQFESLSPQGVLDRIPKYPEAICITGGEPFLQGGMDDFIEMAAISYEVDIFTNGSFPFALKFFDDRYYDNVRFIMDWKLHGSGEAMTALETRSNNAAMLTSKDSIKFVVKDRADLEEARLTYASLVVQGVHLPEFWVGAAWGHISDAEIVDFVLERELPWRLNIQTHKHVWDPDRQLV